MFCDPLQFFSSHLSLQFYYRICLDIFEILDSFALRSIPKQDAAEVWSPDDSGTNPLKFAYRMQHTKSAST